MGGWVGGDSAGEKKKFRNKINKILVSPLNLLFLF